MVFDPRETDDPWPKPEFGRQCLRSVEGDWLEMDAIAPETQTILRAQGLQHRYILIGQLMVMGVDVDAFVSFLRAKGISYVDALSIANRCDQWCAWNL